MRPFILADQKYPQLIRPAALMLRQRVLSVGLTKYFLNTFTLAIRLKTVARASLDWNKSIWVLIQFLEALGHCFKTHGRSIVFYNAFLGSSWHYHQVIPFRLNAILTRVYFSIQEWMAFRHFLTKNSRKQFQDHFKI